jgi:hypothetical protein
MLFYGCIIAPMIFEWELTLYVFAGYFAQMFAVDIITALMLMKSVHMKICNCFAIVQVLLGNLRKALILSVSYLGVYGYQKQTWAYKFEAFLVCVTILSTVINQIKEIGKGFKLD